MYKHLVFIVVVLPWIGVYLMERSWFGPSIARFGEPNGATAVYAAHALVVWGIAYLIISRRVLYPKLNDHPRPLGSFSSAAMLALLFQIICLAATLFLFGGIAVVTGEVGKGEFRSSLGELGAVANLIIKVFSPSTLAYLAFLYSRSRKSYFDLFLLLINSLVVFMIGASWGFKALAVTMLLPAALIYFWRVKLWQVAVLGALGGLTIVLFAFYYDNDSGLSGDFVLVALLMRLTVIQGDVVWHIWDLYQAGVEFPDYWRTLVVFLGDRIFSLATGITPDDYPTWVSYHYDLLVTHLAGVPLHAIKAGHSITATPVAEGIIAFGMPFYLIFSVIAGVLVGLVYNFIDSALASGRGVIATVFCCYFIFNLFTWLFGGAILQLFHIATIFGMLVTIGWLHVVAQTLKLRRRHLLPAGFGPVRTSV